MKIVAVSVLLGCLAGTLSSAASSSAWTLMRNGTDDGGWSARCSFASVAMNGTLFVLGGGTSRCLTDVWGSSRGGQSGTWNKTGSIDWAPRSAFPAVVLRRTSEIVVLGGCNGGFERFNDVQSSRAGSGGWEPRSSSAAWSKRCCHAAVTLPDDTILVLGGHDDVDEPSGPAGYKNDVWASKDGGVTWSLRTSLAKWSPRDALAAVVLRSGEILVLGGHDGSKGAKQWHQDVWKSSDGGVSWSAQTTAAAWSRRSAMQAVVLPGSGDVLVLGGWGSDGLLNDVWKSSDEGASWQALEQAPWAPRWWFGTVVSGSRVFVLGGLDENGRDLGDVWSLDVTGWGGAGAVQIPASRSVFSIVPAGGGTKQPVGSLLCLEGTDSSSIVQTLQALKESPLASLYNASEIQQASCVNRGFTQNGGADQCFSSLNMWYAPLRLPAYPGVPQTDKANLYQYESIVDGLLVGHDFNHHQANGTAAGKVCQRNFTISPRPSVVSAAVTVEGRHASSEKVGSHVPDPGLLCNEGPLDGPYTIYNMVTTLKNGSLGSIQQLDGVQNVSCSERGFTVSQGKPDHCYPPAVLWYTGDVFSLYKASWLETGAMLSFDFDHEDPPGTGEKIAVCDCRPGSEVREGLPPGYCS